MEPAKDTLMKAFQSDAFQNNAFQITGTVIDDASAGLVYPQYKHFTVSFPITCKKENLTELIEMIEMIKTLKALKMLKQFKILKENKNEIHMEYA